MVIIRSNIIEKLFVGGHERSSHGELASGRCDLMRNSLSIGIQSTRMILEFGRHLSSNSTIRTCLLTYTIILFIFVCINTSLN